MSPRNAEPPSEALSTEDVVTVKLPPEFKAAWVAALRSGKYQQATEVLKNPDGHFCCLGVALDLKDSTKWATELRRELGTIGYDWGSCKASETTQALAREIGLPREVCKDLTLRNDGTGNFYKRSQSFAEIADWIEANL